MRVAYVSMDPGVPVFGYKGCSIHVQEVVRALRKKGARVSLFTTRPDGEPTEDLRNIPVFEIPVTSGSPEEREERCMALNLPLYRALKENGPFDLVYERYSLWSFAAIDYANDVGIPAILEVNSPLIEEQKQHRRLFHPAEALGIAERTFRSASHLIAVSSEVAAYVESFCAADRIRVIPNGVNADRFPMNLAPSLRKESGAFVVGFVGTLKPWHGLPVLVDAFAELSHTDPGARLLIVGDGQERSTLVRDLESRGFLDHARFTGAVPSRQVPGLLASMDVAVAPYPDEERFYFSPLKVFEYMAAARPVVASKVGQIPEIIRHGINGLLCPPGDVQSLVAGLLELKADEDLRLEMGRAARETVLRDYTWEQVAEKIIRLAAEGG